LQSIFSTLSAPFRRRSTRYDGKYRGTISWISGKWIWCWFLLLGWNGLGAVLNLLDRNWMTGIAMVSITVGLMFLDDYRISTRLALWRTLASIGLAHKTRIIVRDDLCDYDRWNEARQLRYLREKSGAGAAEMGSMYMRLSRLNGPVGDYYGHAATLYFRNVSAAVEFRLCMNDDVFIAPDD